MAQLTDNKQRAPVPLPSEQQKPPTTVYDSQARIEPKSPRATAEAGARRSDDAESPPPNAPPTVSSVRVEPKPDATPQKNEEQPAANAPPAQPAPKPAETVDEMRVEVEGRKANVQPGVASASEVARERKYQAEAQKSADLASASSNPAKSKTTDSRSQSGGATSTFRVAQGQDKDRVDGVIRSVGGRRFRKQGGVWVDTAYDSESTIVNIARGSEQYRALVADEPAIKTIADELDGSIIVVWKGRTYRIR